MAVGGLARWFGGSEVLADFPDHRGDAMCVCWWSEVLHEFSDYGGDFDYGGDLGGLLWGR